MFVFEIARKKGFCDSYTVEIMFDIVLANASVVFRSKETI